MRSTPARMSTFRADDTRYLGGFFAHYEIADWAQPYAEFSFMSDRTASNIAPSGAFRGSGLDGGDVDINCNNPLMSAPGGDPALRERRLARERSSPSNLVAATSKAGRGKPTSSTRTIASSAA